MPFLGVDKRHFSDNVQGSQISRARVSRLYPSAFHFRRVCACAGGRARARSPALMCLLFLLFCVVVFLFACLFLLVCGYLFCCCLKKKNRFVVVVVVAKADYY